MKGSDALCTQTHMYISYICACFLMQMTQFVYYILVHICKLSPCTSAVKHFQLMKRTSTVATRVPTSTAQLFYYQVTTLH